MTPSQGVSAGKAETDELPAGDFSSWLASTVSGLENDGSAQVPCGSCTACCTSSYFIHIRPDEVATLARIPDELLFPAPGLPGGNVLLGYDESGRCPMLVEERCSIYEDRPLTCKSYDCRVFAAAGIDAGGDDKARIEERARRWGFAHFTPRSHQQHSAVKAAARFLEEHADCFPSDFLPDNPTQRAILAIKIHDVFLQRADEGDSGTVSEISELARAVMQASENFITSNRE